MPKQIKQIRCQRVNGRFIRLEKIIENDIVSTQNFSFLNYNNKTILPDREYYNKSIDSILSIEFGNQFVMPVMAYKSDKFIFVVTEYFMRNYLSFYDKHKNKMTTGIDLFSNGLIFPKVKKVKDDIIYCLVHPWELNSAIDINFLTEDSKKHLSEIKIEDNPIIIIYYAK